MTSAIETTQVLGTDHTDGLHLVYLPKYCDPDAPEQSEDDESIYRRFTDYLARLSPGFSRDEVVDWTVQRAKLVEPVHQLRADREPPEWRRSGPGSRAWRSPPTPRSTPTCLNGDSVMGFAEGVAARSRRRAADSRAAGQQCEKRTSRHVVLASHVPGRSLQSAAEAAPLGSAAPHALRVPRNVVMLGMVSLLTDVSSEMVATILPLYLVFSLGASPLALGAIDGTYRGAAALVQVASGFASDRWRRHKEVAGLGYGLSARRQGGAGRRRQHDRRDRRDRRLRPGRQGDPHGAARRADLALQHAKTASRPPSACTGRWTASGAMLGPLVAFGILLVAPARFDAVFVVSTLFALLGLAVLVLTVQGKPQRAPREDKRRPFAARRGRPGQGPALRAPAARRRRALDGQRLRRDDLRRPAAQDRLRPRPSSRSST